LSADFDERLRAARERAYGEENVHLCYCRERLAVGQRRMRYDAEIEHARDCVYMAERLVKRQGLIVSSLDERQLPSDLAKGLLQTYETVLENYRARLRLLSRHGDPFDV